MQARGAGHIGVVHVHVIIVVAQPLGRILRCPGACAAYLRLPPADVQS